MGDSTKIQWTDATWNPVRGCTVVSAGCENCYAMGVAARFSGEGQPYEGLARFSPERRLPQWTGKVRLVPEHLADPLRWTKPRRVFVNSMSDLFHEELTNEEIAAVFGVMAASPRHTFQVLTKRAKRMREWFEWMGTPNASTPTPRNRAHYCADKYLDMSERGFTSEWPLPNVWLGVSAENQEAANARLYDLEATPAAVRFVSYEPAIGDVDFSRWLPSLDWIIVGGESGPRARPFDVEWARSLVWMCKVSGTAVFVKQMGRHLVGNPRGFEVDAYDLGAGHWWRPGILTPEAEVKRIAGHAVGFCLVDKKGGDMSAWPRELRVRQFPP